VLVRVVTAVALIPPVLAILWFNPLGRGVFVLVGVVSAGMLFEWVQMAKRAEVPCGLYDFVLAWLATLLWMLSVRQPRLGEAEPLLVVGVVFGAFAPTLVTGRVEGGAARAMWTLLAALYVGDCFARHALLLYELRGRVGLFALLGAVWTCDTAAYFVGRVWGRSPLAPRISPAKTWEGAAAGLVGATLAGTLIVVAFDAASWRVALGGSVLVGVVAQVGDLAESLVKRCVGVKDSGHLVPGHGGLLDRLDSLVFAIPALYWYLRFAGVAS